MTLHRFTTAIALCGLLTAPLAAQAAYPDKPVSIIVPWAPGGTVDFIARQLAQKLSESLGQSFVVENRPGGAGTIGGGYVARSRPDGYTLMAIDGSYAVIPTVYKTLNWNAATDISGIDTLIQTPMVMVVPQNSPFASAKELIDYARANPGKLNYGSGGTGSTTHVAAALFAHAADISLTHIPYKGGGEAMLAVMSGTVDVLFTAPPSALPSVRGGKVKALGHSGSQPLAAQPDIRPISELGLPSYRMDNWFGLVAPKGVPADVIATLERAIQQALRDPTLRDQLRQQGAEVHSTSAKAFDTVIQRDIQQWQDLDKQTGFSANK